VKQSRSVEWASEWTRLIGKNVRTIRKAKSLSTQRLSDLCSERAGFEVPRNTIVNLETGRKESISVQELVAIALASETPPVSLLYPLDQEVEIAPGQRRNAFHAVEWFSGRWGPIAPHEYADSDHRLVDPNLTELRDYVRWAHHAMLEAEVIDAYEDRKARGLREAAQESLDWAMEQIAAIEARLAERGIRPPELPGLDSVRRRSSR
jgi:transcriptional regulator with XRE-family HTH domain